MKRILFYLFLFSHCIAFAQKTVSEQKEYVIEDEKGHSVYPITASQNTLVYYKTTDKRSKEHHWHFELLNQSLTPIKQLELTSSSSFDIYHVYTNENHFYLLLYNRAKGLYETHDILLDNLTYQSKSGELGKGMDIMEVYVIPPTMFISFKISRKIHQIFTIDLTKGVAKHIVPTEMTDAKLVFEDAQVISKTEMAFKYKVCIKGEGCEYHIIRFDANGNQLGDFYVVPKPDADREITYISMSKATDNSYFVTGTFSASRSQMANGIFFSKVTNGKTEFIKYYNFLDLNNFTNYLSDRKQEKIEKKKAEKEENGKDFFISYNVAIHDIVERNGEYVFIGEFFYPTYRTEYRTVSGPNGTTSRTSYQVFDGYQYSHAALAGFDGQGNLTWSNTFEMWLMNKPFIVKKFIRKNFHDDLVDLIYNNGSMVKSVTFKKDQVVKEEQFTISLETGDENDKVKRSYDSEVQWWYERNYIHTRTMVIKNDEKDDKKRRVFMVSKVSY